MAVVSRRQPSAVVSAGLSLATVALNVAGAATDSVPIAKQILNSAAHISAFAERMHKKQLAMYMLIQKTEIYSTQIDIAVAGRVLDARLQQRLARLLSVFVKIESLVEEKLGRKKHPVRVWHLKFITKPNRAEDLAAELDQEMTLFNLLTSIQLSLTVDDTVRAVAEDARYDGQFRLLRDCDIEKLDVIDTCETHEGVVVWASARVDGQLMVIRYLESQPHAKRNTITTLDGSTYSWDVYIEHIKKVSTVCGSHPHIVQLYGRHVQGPGVVFKAGTCDVLAYLETLRAVEGNTNDTAVKYSRLVYKILDASAHLEDVHGLRWVGFNAVVDENGEPRIGLFDDIFRVEPSRWDDDLVYIPENILLAFNHRTSEETGVVDQVHDSALHTIIKEHLRDGNDSDRLNLQQVWDIIRREQLYVRYDKNTYPVISANLALPQKLIARAQLYFKTYMDDTVLSRNSKSLFLKEVVIGRDANKSSRLYIHMGLDDDKYKMEVEACTHDDNHMHHHHFYIHIPVGSPLLAAILRAAGLSDDFEYSWSHLRPGVHIYSEMWHNGRFAESHADSGSEEDDDNYETADEGDGSFDPGMIDDHHLEFASSQTSRSGYTTTVPWQFAPTVVDGWASEEMSRW